MQDFFFWRILWSLHSHYYLPATVSHNDLFQSSGDTAFITELSTAQQTFPTQKGTEGDFSISHTSHYWSLSNHEQN